MDIAIITGSSGLIGSESVSFLANKFDCIVGIDNDMRKYFFGEEGSTKWNKKRLLDKYDNFESFLYLHLNFQNYHIYLISASCSI